MVINILTLFPKMFKGPFDESIIKRAQEKGLVEIKIHDLRDFGEGERRTVDDRPYGGGVGMILRVDIIDAALKKIKNQKSKIKITTKNSKIILLDAGGERFTQKKAEELSKLDHLAFIAGHYEGVDARVQEHLVDETISIGDYVLTGGELPTMVLVDSIVRLIPGVLEKPEATSSESFSPLEIRNLTAKRVTQLEIGLEYPQFTRPETYRGWKVPKILLSGNHKEIEKWRKTESLKKTEKIRPDLIPG